MTAETVKSEAQILPQWGQTGPAGVDVAAACLQSIVNALVSWSDNGHKRVLDSVLHCVTLCITLALESSSCFIPSTSSCSLSSWFTSSCTHHLSTLSVFTVNMHHTSVFHSELKTHLFLQSLLALSRLPLKELDSDWNHRTSAFLLQFFLYICVHVQQNARVRKTSWAFSACKTTVS